MKGPDCYILTFYNQYCYNELSILFLFILSQDKPAWVNLILFYIDLRKYCYFYYILFQTITEYCFFSNVLNMFFCDIFQHVPPLKTNKSTTIQFLIINNVVEPLKEGALSGIGWSWWGISRLRYKSPVLS